MKLIDTPLNDAFIIEPRVFGDERGFFLESWNAKETASARRLAALGEQMEQAFVWAAPDLGAMEEEEAQQWWSESITFPEDFTYVTS